MRKLYIYNTYGGCTFTFVIETYQRRFNSRPYVLSTTFGLATLGANGVAKKLFLAFLLSNPEVGIQFLQDVGLIRSSIFTDETSDLD